MTATVEPAAPQLPPEFADLQKWASEWILPTLEDRLQHRLETPMDQLQEFRGTVFERAEAAMDYLDQFPVDDLPETAEHLMQLLYALSVASVATDVFSSQKDPNTGDTWIYETVEPPF